jgi:uncharacterized protein (UPF0335 family)
MRKKTAQNRKLKKILIRFTEKEKKEVEQLAKGSGFTVSEFFRELIKTEKKHLQYQPYINKIEQINHELKEKLKNIEKCMWVMN